MRDVAESILVGPLAYVWRHQGHHPWLRGVARWLGTPFRTRTGRILAGVGRGLRFDTTGGAASYRLGLIELDVQRVLRDRLRRGMVVYDVGASIGFHSVLAARLVGPTGRVIAFEPEADLLARVERNAALNGFSHVTALLVALGQTDGEGTITLQIRSPGRGPTERQGPLRKLDSVVAALALPPPQLIKLDVEGAELGVLEGARATLRQARPVLLIEAHGTEHDVAAFLRDAGYRCELISRTHADQQHLLALAEG